MSGTLRKYIELNVNYITLHQQHNITCCMLYSIAYYITTTSLTSQHDECYAQTFKDKKDYNTMSEGVRLGCACVFKIYVIFSLHRA